MALIKIERVNKENVQGQVKFSILRSVIVDSNSLSMISNDGKSMQTYGKVVIMIIYSIWLIWVRKPERVQTHKMDFITLDAFESEQVTQVCLAIFQ